MKRIYFSVALSALLLVTPCLQAQVSPRLKKAAVAIAMALGSKGLYDAGTGFVRYGLAPLGAWVVSITDEGNCFDCSIKKYLLRAQEQAAYELWIGAAQVGFSVAALCFLCCCMQSKQKYA